MSHSAEWYLEQAKKARKNRPDGWVQMSEVLASHIEDILSGECDGSLVLDTEAVLERRKFYEEKIKELRRGL
ncbi:MAG: hypothetical protein CMB80_07900 [Flammeovirgaceae bacterium]|nr:hypothetical protein [Flammeovirgaceae bacterium]|tara:strand:+ start:20421 stop:20636 length:216 start_codon:yes stop_codon:yes gene_type:complete